MNRINATWRYFSPLRFPFMGKVDPEDTTAPDRILTVLFGTLLALISMLLLFLSGKISFSAQTLCGLLIVPLLLEIFCGAAGLKALSAFLANRQSRISFEEALHGTYEPGTWSFSRIFLLILIYILRSAMIGALAVCGSYYWLVITLTGAYFVRAELSTVRVPGGEEFFPVEGEKRSFHGPVSWLIMFGAGLCHSLNLLPVLIAAGITWLMGSYGAAICSETEQGMSTNAMRLLGFSAEMILLAAGTLIYIR